MVSLLSVKSREENDFAVLIISVNASLQVGPLELKSVGVKYLKYKYVKLEICTLVMPTAFVNL